MTGEAMPHTQPSADEDPRILVREATTADASFLAWVMLAAARSHLKRGAWDYLLGWDEARTLDFLTQLALSEPEHLFTYQRFVVAEVDGQLAAALSGHRPEVHGFGVYIPVFDELLRANGVDDAECADIARRGDVLTSAFAEPAPRGACVIESVATAPPFRRMGLVDRLLATILDLGRAAGCETGRIDTLYIGNEHARRAYLKHGFDSTREVRSGTLLEIFGSPGFEVLARPL
jgi:ribosomal protein S18 acetylase RimI-like enzyme